MINSASGLERKPRSRAFAQPDLDAICQLLAKRQTEAGACSILGISYDSFKNWKCRAKAAGKIDYFLTRARSTQLNAHVENIEAAALGQGIHPKPDWRASESLIKLKFPELAPQPGQVTVQPVINIAIMNEAAKRIYDAPNALETILIPETSNDTKINSDAMAAPLRAITGHPRIIIPTRRVKD